VALAGANLVWANGRGVNLSGANLTDVNIQLMDLRGANLTGVVWSNTKCPDGRVTSTGC
jgi:uncharacterized protein YjbI with pentapeptide repeats